MTQNIQGIRFKVMVELIIASALLTVAGLTYFDSPYTSTIMILGGIVSIDAFLLNYQLLSRKQNNE